MSRFRDTSVLVTGATGFIGGHLARALALSGARVHGSGRNLAAAEPLRDLGVLLHQADICQPSQMAPLVQGQDTVFHVAAWLGADRPNAEPAHEINVTAVESLVRQAAAAGVRRFLHVSSIAVYGPPPDGSIRTTLPVNVADNDEYGRTKAMGERVARELGAELGLEVTVVRPGMVYGPGSQTWTATLARVVKKGVPAIFGAGDGHASPIYIDHLVDLLIRAAHHPAAAGRIFHGVDGPVPWVEFFRAYGDMVGRPPRSIPLWLARALAGANEVLPLGLPLNRNRVRHYVAKPLFDMTEARELLGWAPRLEFTEAMAESGRWLRETGQLS